MTTTGRSNWQAAFKTVLLLSVLGGILVGAGYLIGGPQTALIFLFISVAINLGSWFFSDKIALAAARAQPVSQQDDPRLYQMVQELTTRAGLPMLPVTHGEAATRLQILLYSLVLVPVTLLIAPLSGLGPLYWVSAALLGAWFILDAVLLYRAPSTSRAMGLFRYSIVYLFVLFAFMFMDAILRTRAGG